MRGSKAKIIRKSVYGEQSLRRPRHYIFVDAPAANNLKKPHGCYNRTTIKNDPQSLRGLYLKAKAVFPRGVSPR